MAEGFRIERISIEGFKGFTRAQEIELKNRHVFLLGPNGKGKSSIVEAIRWGLFGSTGRRNDVVRNGSYSGECRVVIDLSRDSNEWNLTRVLMPGSGESRLLFRRLFDREFPGLFRATGGQISRIVRSV